MKKHSLIYISLCVGTLLGIALFEILILPEIFEYNRNILLFTKIIAVFITFIYWFFIRERTALKKSLIVNKYAGVTRLIFGNIKSRKSNDQYLDIISHKQRVRRFYFYFYVVLNWFEIISILALSSYE